jgi:TP901 family phage tail tape measure protein
MTTYTTSILLKLIDQITGPIKNINSNLSRLSTTAGRIGSNFSKISSQTALSAQAGSQFAAIGRKAIAKPTEAFEGFEHEMARVRGLTKATSDQFTRLTTEAKRLGSSIGEFSALDAAKGMSEYGMAGYTTNQIIKALPTTLNLATAAQVELADTIGVTTGIMGAFGLEASQIDRTSDVLTATFTGSKTTLRSLGETMSYVGSIARNAGVSLEETAIMAGLLGNASIEGSRAGTTLKGMLLKLAGAGRGKSAKILGSLGIEIEKMEKGTKVLRGPLDLLGELHSKIAKLGPAARTKILAKIFGSEVLPGVQQLLQNLDSEKLRQLTKDINAAHGATKNLALIMRTTSKNATLEMMSALDGLYITLGEKLAPTLLIVKNFARDVAIGITAWSKEHPSLIQGIMVTIAAITGLATVLAGVLITISTVTSALSLASFALGGTATGAQLLGAALSTSVIPALASMAAAAWPIVVVVGAVAALAGAGYLLFRYWDPIANWFTGMWDRFKSASLGAKIVIVGALTALTIPLLPFIALATPFIAAIVAIAAAFKYWEPIKVFVGEMWDEILAGSKRGLERFKKDVATIKTFISDAVEWVQEKIAWIKGQPLLKGLVLTADIVTKPAQLGFAAAKATTGFAAEAISGWSAAGKEAFGVLTGPAEPAKPIESDLIEARTEPIQWGPIAAASITDKKEVKHSMKIEVEDNRVRVRQLETGGEMDFESFAYLGSSNGLVY